MFYGTRATLKTRELWCYVLWYESYSEDQSCGAMFYGMRATLKTRVVVLRPMV